ncbi:hypothetical protein [Anabaena sp. CCY 9402-a]|uniref:hypothetical protein n=1 Tax=Anabaena sp. CCY 9402-a TaxID=3103867 RepID=UPI0039C64446
MAKHNSLSRATIPKNGVDGWARCTDSSLDCQFNWRGQGQDADLWWLEPQV